MDTRAVEQAMTNVADAEIRPRFRALAEGDVNTKSGPHDFVTVADTAAEHALTALLRKIRDFPVIGEEASAENPSLLDVLVNAPAAWVVDPIDGTANFVHGSERYAVMVALVEQRRATRGWILHPESGDLFVGFAGRGATLNGMALPTQVGHGKNVGELRGQVSIKHAAPPVREAILALEGQIGAFVEPQMCAGFDYGDIARGDLDFALYVRTMPWDHAPGAAIVRECGIRVARLTGDEYEAGDSLDTLLVAPTDVWVELRDVIAPAFTAAG